MPHARRFHNGDRYVGLMQQGDDTLLITAGGFADDEQRLGKGFELRDQAAMAIARHWGDVAPFYVDQEEPMPPGGLPAPGRIVVKLPDNHLQYAITWFGLGAALVGVYGFWVFGRFRRT